MSLAWLPGGPHALAESICKLRTQVSNPGLCAATGQKSLLRAQLVGGRRKPGASEGPPQRSEKRE